MLIQETFSLLFHKTQKKDLIKNQFFLILPLWSPPSISLSLIFDWSFFLPTMNGDPSHFQDPMGRFPSDGGAEGEKRTLWVGDVEQWMDESYLKDLFAAVSEVNTVKLIRDRTTGITSGYGFIEFRSHEGAQRVLQQLNGQVIPGVGRAFRLNWATFGISPKY